jgi:hypothetical protein
MHRGEKQIKNFTDTSWSNEISKCKTYKKDTSPCTDSSSTFPSAERWVGLENGTWKVLISTTAGLHTCKVTSLEVTGCSFFS